MTDPEKLTTEDWIARQRAILDKWGVCPILSWVRDALEEEAERLKKHEQAEAIRIEAVAGVIDRARQNVSVVTDLVNAAERSGLIYEWGQEHDHDRHRP